jgi:hypothetical protein
VRSCLTERPIRPPAIRREGHGEFLRAADRELLRLEADLSDDLRAVAGSAPSCATRLHDGRRNRRFAGALRSSKVRRARGSRGPRATGRTGRARRLDRTARALVRLPSRTTSCRVQRPLLRLAECASQNRGMCWPKGFRWVPRHRSRRAHQVLRKGCRVTRSHDLPDKRWVGPARPQEPCATLDVAPSSVPKSVTLASACPPAPQGPIPLAVPVRARRGVSAGALSIAKPP